MKTFEDLGFKDRHEFDDDSKQAIIFFPNNYGASVLFGERFYSNGVNTYEIACIHKEDKAKSGFLLVYPEGTSFEDDVRGYCTKDEISKLMIEIQNFSKNEN